MRWPLGWLVVACLIRTKSIDAYTVLPPSLSRQSGARPGGFGSLLRASTQPIYPSPEASDLKRSLLAKVSKLRDLQDRDGDLSVDFGVRGGELNETSRAPNRVDYYRISDEVGEAADDVLGVCERLSRWNPCEEPTRYLGCGDEREGALAPLNGTWRQLFTTAADASFSKNSTRGSALVRNVVDGARGRITNVIDFDANEDGSEPALKQLNVVIKAVAASKNRVELQFKYAKAVLTKFFFLPLFGRRLTLYIPVPAAFITRIIVFFSRILKFGRGGAKKVPKAYFDVLYLDKDLRIQKTGDDNFFVQASDRWEMAKPLVKRYLHASNDNERCCRSNSY